MLLLKFCCVGCCGLLPKSYRPPPKPPPRLIRPAQTTRPPPQVPLFVVFARPELAARLTERLLAPETPVLPPQRRRPRRPPVRPGGGTRLRQPQRQPPPLRRLPHQRKLPHRPLQRARVPEPAPALKRHVVTQPLAHTLIFYRAEPLTPNTEPEAAPALPPALQPPLRRLRHADREPQIPPAPRMPLPQPPQPPQRRTFAPNRRVGGGTVAFPRRPTLTPLLPRRAANPQGAPLRSARAAQPQREQGSANKLLVRRLNQPQVTPLPPHNEIVEHLRVRRPSPPVLVPLVGLPPVPLKVTAPPPQRRQAKKPLGDLARVVRRPQTPEPTPPPHAQTRAVPFK